MAGKAAMTWFDDGGNKPPHEPPPSDAIPSRAAYEDRILRVAQRIKERRDAQAFAQAFVRLPAEEQERIREEFNRPNLLLDLTMRDLQGEP